MFEAVETRGGAGEFEAAVIAVVLDRIAEEEKAARQAGPPSRIPDWMRVYRPENPAHPLDIDRYGP